LEFLYVKFIQYALFNLKINGLYITMHFYLYSYTNICTEISHYKIHERD